MVVGWGCTTFYLGETKMENFIEAIEEPMATLVYLTSAFAVASEFYYAQCNKSSKEYDYELASHFLRQAQNYSQRAIAICKENGLDPEKICMNCIEFQQQYKRAV